MDKLKNLGDKLKHGATEFADKHELKAKAEELKEKAEETVVQLTHPGSGQMDTAAAIAAANKEGGAVSSTARTTEEEDEKEKLKLEIAQLGGSITSVKTNTEDKSEMKKILDPLVNGGAIAAANIEGGAVSSTARTTEEEDEEKEKLKLEIEQLGGSITSAKKNTEDKSELKKMLDPLVVKLLAAKAKFASMNNGIGVDGKPHGG
eukprot:CAMPEP_0171043668 /NCGR_PEP_ID=MMETSP0736-20130129/47176_1 /TAXON_ID=186038 /ORGANISM="Fragilariopsis kerguelensis, Strain L26-C5" /LENGTH=204 /DNA_ID=CAMNT_0011492761 /DNA_START=143 /DNA_END=754 /DNA_ORIENTATION=+